MARSWWLHTWTLTSKRLTTACCWPAQSCLSLSLALWTSDPVGISVRPKALANSHLPQMCGGPTRRLRQSWKANEESEAFFRRLALRRKVRSQDNCPGRRSSGDWFQFLKRAWTLFVSRSLRWDGELMLDIVCSGNHEVMRITRGEYMVRKSSP